MDLKIELSLKDTKPFQDIINLLKEILEDDDINNSTKEKYLNKLQAIISLNRDLA